LSQLFWESLFFKQLSHFLRADVFGENGKNNAFLGFNVKRLEIKLRVQRGMTLLIVTFTCNLAAKTLIFLGQKKRIKF